jgi:hypothetical protein
MGNNKVDIFFNFVLLVAASVLVGEHCGVGMGLATACALLFLRG